MARPVRLEIPGGVYHVIVRGNERKAIFRDDTDRQRYLDQLGHYQASLGFSLLAYCLLDNHAHLAIRTGGVPLARAMARIQSSYTQWFNRRHRRVGHLFQGRYKAFLVEEDPYLLSLVRYIHENPVKAGLARRPQDYPWSSDRHYRDGKAPGWLDRTPVLGILGRTRRRAVASYRVFMGSEEEEPYEKAGTWAQTVKGEAGFAQVVLERAGEPPLKRRDVTIPAVLTEVCRLSRLDEKAVCSASRSRPQARARYLVAWACREVAGSSAASVAKFFRRDTSTLAVGLRKLEEALRRDAELRKVARTLAARLRGQA